MKRFSKIFTVVMAIAMLASVFCFPSSAVIDGSSVTVNVNLEKVTTPGEVVCADSGADATELGNIYKVTLGFTSVNAGLSKFQASVVYDEALFDVCCGDGVDNFISYKVSEVVDDMGWGAACTWKGTAADADAYDTNGVGGQTSAMKIKAYGLKHANAGTTFVAEKLDPTSEAYGNVVNWAYPGEAAPANRGAFTASYKLSTSNNKGLIIPNGDETEVVTVYLSLQEGKTDADVDGTEIRVSNIDYSGVALANLTAYGSLYGMAKTAQQDTVGSITANGLSYVYEAPKAPSPVYAKGSQIRFNGTEADGAKANFDVRTRAALTAADFATICGSEDNAKALADAGKLQVGFVYTAGTMDVATAKAVATGTAADGYKNVPVTYIQSTGSEYVWTCLITNADYAGTVQALAYIIVDGTAYYFDAASTTTFSSLYDVYYPQYAASLS